MGTNYYLHETPDLLGRLAGEEEVVRHIGKSSGGWCFSLRVYPADSINSIRDWWRLFNRGKNYITDEYGRVIHLDEMMTIITKRFSTHIRTFPTMSYRSEEQFYTSNFAEPGPNNLLRHKLDSRCVVGHGGGTWDYLKGEFS